VTFLSMRLVPGALLGAIVLVSPTGAMAQDEPDEPDETSPAVEYRQSLMQGLAAHRSAVTAIVDDEVEYRSHILAHATALRRLAVMATDVFPEGSAGEGSRAMDEIWENADEFQEVLEGLQDATSGLLDAVYAGDIGAVEEALTAVAGSCRDCHRAFRARPSGAN